MDDTPTASDHFAFVGVSNFEVYVDAPIAPIGCDLNRISIVDEDTCNISDHFTHFGFALDFADVVVVIGCNFSDFVSRRTVGYGSLQPWTRRWTPRPGLDVRIHALTFTLSRIPLDFNILSTDSEG